MLHKQINRKIKEIKALVLRLSQDFLEPTVWEEFSVSLSPDGRGNYLIRDDDFPDIRDLKAFLNMLAAIERATESYSLMSVSVFKRMELPHDIWEFRRNYKIYMATNGVFSQYLALVKEFALVTVFPVIAVKLQELYQLCTSENLEKANEFLIEQVINLEQYQEKYKEKKRKAAEQEEVEEPEEGFVDKLVKKNDALLRKLYGEEYDTHFAPTAQEETQGYYPDRVTDNDTVKNLKSLANGIIGIKKVFDDFIAFNRSGMLAGVSCIALFVIDVRKVNRYLHNFDYQAIIAEKTNPAAEKIKTQITRLYDALEKLSCIADHFECAYALKEGTLLRLVDLIIQRYTLITSELKIVIDYAKLKRTFHASRMQAREQLLQLIQSQLNRLNPFFGYRHHTIAEIPVTVLCDMQAYITKYHGAICMDRGHLAQYEKYLTEAMQTKSISMMVAIMNGVEFWANRAGLTLHAEIMSVFDKQKLYLEKQRLFLEKRLQGTKDKYSQQPYDNFNLSEIKADPKKAVFDKLNQHLLILNREKDKLFEQMVPETKEAKEEVKFSFSERSQNQMLSKIRELGIFSSAVSEYEGEEIPASLQKLTETISQETGLSPSSLSLIEEIKEINRVTLSGC